MSALFLLVVLSFLVAGAEWLGRRGVFRHVGPALLVFLPDARAANLGITPFGSAPEAPAAGA